ncbi:MAG: hypothetical protein K6A65_06390, partial [Succinivibrionaceae bacterium]|nr:hypothetical protein [Succinivibrionaceae bacterium]
MKPSSHALAMLIAAYRKLLRRARRAAPPPLLPRAALLALPLTLAFPPGAGAYWTSTPPNTNWTDKGDVPLTEGSEGFTWYAGKVSDAQALKAVSYGSLTASLDAYGQPRLYGGFSQGGAASNNELVVSSAAVIMVDSSLNLIERAAGGEGTGSANGNRVSLISGNAVSVFGGSAAPAADGTATAGGTATAQGNAVEVSGGIIRHELAGGYAVAVGGAQSLTASGNTVTITGGTFGLYSYDTVEICGGYAVTADPRVGSRSATGNQVLISGGSFVGKTVIAGGAAQTQGSVTTATVTGNSVYLGYAGGAVAQYGTLDLSNVPVYGGATMEYCESLPIFSGADEGNSIFASGTVSVKSIGGYTSLTLNIGQVNAMGSATDSATGKDVAVLQSTAEVDLSAKTLTLTAEDDSLAGQNYALVYSASRVVAPSSSPTSVLRSGTFTSTLYSNAIVGRSADGKLLYVALPAEPEPEHGTASEGTTADGRPSVSVESGTYASTLVAASKSAAAGDTAGVSATGVASASGTATVNGSLLGASAGSAGSGAASATSSVALVSGSATVTGNVAGGLAEATGTGDAGASANSASVSGGTVSGKVYGGHAEAEGDGAASASANSASVSGGEVSGTVYGGRAESEGAGRAMASANSATVSGGTVNADVHGGNAESEGTGEVEASANTARVSGGTVNGSVYGGHALGRGTAVARGNTVALTGGKVTGNAVGGYADPDEVAAATGNSVYVTPGASVDGCIIGGLAEGTEGASLTATGNSVWLGYSEGGAAQYGTLDLSSATVYGGATKHTTSDTLYAADTGNTIHASGRVSVKAIRGYSGLTLNIGGVNAMGSATDSATGAPLAVLQSTAAVDLSSRSLTLTAEDEGLAGQNYALLYSASGVTLPGNSVTDVVRTGTFTSTIYANASVKASDDGTLLYADLTSASLISATTLNPEAETLSAAALAGAAMAGTLNSFSS